MFGIILGIALLPVTQTSRPLPSKPPAIVLYTEQDVPQLQFAATELRRACLALGLPLIERPLQQLDADQKGQGAPDSILLLSRAPGTGDQAILKELKAPEKPSPQGYAIRRVEKAPGQRLTVVLGADPVGAMYGGIDLAEAVRLGRLADVKDADHAPAILRRGIKFNAPLDLRTPSYSDNSDSAQANIPEMWSLDFWKPFLDEMARDRYNVLTLWSLHPFPSLVKVPEYPEVALDDVQRTRLPLDDTFSHRGHDMVRPEMLEDVEVVKHLNIEDKIAFWRQVMQHAHDRGIEVYLFTWNIFTFGADGKYGITPAQDNQKTIDYFRASVRETVRTYPLMAGFGITAGEQMEQRDDEFDKEPWLWKTYGKGILDALESEPGRSVRLIHRFHETAQSEILDAWKDYPEPIDLSFKYAIAHMYSSPSPPFLKPIVPQLPPGRRLWLTVRNDDIYSFRWGDPAYVREFLSNLPGPDVLAGFYMGPDGTTWGRETLSRLPAETPRELEIQKHWFSFWLWGRLSYDPNLPDALIERLVASRFPEADGHSLLETWSRASRIIPQITRFFWGDIDLKWFPEACLSHPRHKGFYTVKDFVEGQTMPGTGIATIRQWRDKAGLGQKVEGITPLEVADNLEADGKFTLDRVAKLRSTINTSPELDRTLGDLEAMAWLGLYYAEKIRSASALGLYDLYSRRVDWQEALERAQAASERWSQYAASYDAQYLPQLRNRLGIVDIPALQKKVNHDIEIVRRWKPGTVPPAEARRKDGDQPFRP